MSLTRAKGGETQPAVSVSLGRTDWRCRGAGSLASSRWRCLFRITCDSWAMFTVCLLMSLLMLAGFHVSQVPSRMCGAVWLWLPMGVARALVVVRTAQV